VKRVEHVYFYRATIADEPTRRGYLDTAYRLGRDFSAGVDPNAALPASATPQHA
jgi:hypothetical protein